jgi:hypothetical protein
VHAFVRQAKHAKLERAFKFMFETSLRLKQIMYYQRRGYSKLRRTLGIGRE